MSAKKAFDLTVPTQRRLRDFLTWAILTAQFVGASDEESVEAAESLRDWLAATLPDGDQ